MGCTTVNTKSGKQMALSYTSTYVPHDDSFISGRHNLCFFFQSHGVKKASLRKANKHRFEPQFVCMVD